MSGSEHEAAVVFDFLFRIIFAVFGLCWSSQPSLPAFYSWKVTTFQCMLCCWSDRSPAIGILRVESKSGSLFRVVCFSKMSHQFHKERIHWAKVLITSVIRRDSISGNNDCECKYVELKWRMWMKYNKQIFLEHCKFCCGFNGNGSRYWWKEVSGRLEP